MPVILLDFDSRDNTTAAVNHTSQALDLLNRTMQNMAGTSSRVDQAMQRVATAQNQAAGASLRNQRAMTQAATSVTAYERSVASASTAWDRYSSLLASGANSTQTTAQRQAALTAALEEVAAAGAQVDSTFTRMVANQNRAASAASTLASRINAVQAAQERLNATPAKEPTPTGGAAGGTQKGGGILSTAGGALKNTAIYGGTYAALYGAESAISNSLSRDVSYSQLLGSTAAMTGLSPQQAAKLSDLTRAQAGSGNYPYSAQTLLQGSYSVASLGIGKNDPSKIASVNAIIAKLSTAAGAPDTSSAGDAITNLIAVYGQNNANVVGNVSTLADQLQVGVRLGKIDLPTFALQAGGPLATRARESHVGTADIIASLAAQSVGGNAPGELGQDTLALLGGAASPTRPQRNEARALGLQYDNSFWSKYGFAGGSNIIEEHLQAQGITGTAQTPVLQKLLGQQDAVTAFLTMQAGNIQGFSPQVANSRGAAQAAYETSQSYAGNKLADAEAKLATKFDDLTMLALPALVTAAGSAATALDGITTGLGAFGSFLDSHFGKSTTTDITSGFFTGVRNLLFPASGAADVVAGAGDAIHSAASLVGSPAPASARASSHTAIASPPASSPRLSSSVGLTLDSYNLPGPPPTGNPRMYSSTSPLPAGPAWWEPPTLPHPVLRSTPTTATGAQPIVTPIGSRVLNGEPIRTQPDVQSPINFSALFSPGAAQAGLIAQGASAATARALAKDYVRPPSTAPTGMDNYTYHGPMGKESAAYQLTQTTGQGGTNPQIPAVRDALLTLKDDITQRMSTSVVNSAFAAYQKAVHDTPLLTPVQQRHDIVSAQKLVDRYEQADTATSRATRQLPTAPPGPGALQAGNESTAVRFAGQQDPLILELRILRRELDAANNEIVALLAAWPDALRAALGGGDVARPNSLRLHGARDAKRP